MNSFVKLAALIVTLLLAFDAFSQTQLSIQGVIRSSAGTAVDDGQYEVKFSLYDSIVSGTELWSEVQTDLQVTSGIYSTVLGQVTPLDLPFDQFYSLGLTIEGEEVLPRITLSSSPYANALVGFDNEFPSTGNVGVGTLNPAQKLEVVGSALVDNSVTVGDTVFARHVVLDNTNNGWSSLQLRNNSYGLTISQTSSNIGTSEIKPSGIFNLLSSNGTTAIKIRSNGQVGIGAEQTPNVALDVFGSIQYTGTISDESDRRLKENFKQLENPLESLSKVKAYSYNKKADLEKKIEFGVIAQEIQEIFPNIVSVVNEEKGYLGVCYTQLIPVLIEANKELHKLLVEQGEIIDQLRADNDDLKATVLKTIGESEKKWKSIESRMNTIEDAQSGAKL